MRLYQWISGKELIERWQINPLGLVDIVIYERLPVYEPDGRIVEDIEYEYEYIIRAGHPDLFPLPPPPKKDNPSIYDLIFHPKVYDYKIPDQSVSIPPNYKPMADRIGQLMFKLIEVERFEKENKLILPDSQQDNIEPGKERKKIKSQICREKVRERAKEIWSKHPEITIAAMAISDEITNITMQLCGKMFVDDTIREWIHDICPNSSPGRPSSETQEKIKNWLNRKPSTSRAKEK